MTSLAAFSATGSVTAAAWGIAVTAAGAPVVGGEVTALGVIRCTAASSSTVALDTT